MYIYTVMPILCTCTIASRSIEGAAGRQVAQGTTTATTTTTTAAATTATNNTNNKKITITHKT